MCRRSDSSLATSLMMTRSMKTLLVSERSDPSPTSRTEPSTKESGYVAARSVRARECSTGPMARCMRATGLTARPMVRVVSFTPTVTSTTDSGRMTRRMALAHTVIWTEHSIRATGMRTSSTGTDWRLGQMAPATRATTLRGASTAKAASGGLTRALTPASSVTTTSRDTVSFDSFSASCVETPSWL